MLHQKHNQISLAIAQRIAQGLPQHPEWLDLAKSNLDRWSQLNSDTPSLLAGYQEWHKILDRPLDQIIATLIEPTDNGQRLRQNSPFAGALSQTEVLQIKRQINASITV